MKAVKVRRRDAEKLRRALFEHGLIDRNYKILSEGKWVEIPLIDESNEKMNEMKKMIRSYDAKIIPHKPIRKKSVQSPIENILDAVNLDEKLKILLPRKWELIGDVLIMKLPNELEDYEKDIAIAYAMVKDVGGISGKFRNPNVKLILGSETETIHKENGIRFKLDVKEIMFSSGNIDERLRMACIANENETIVDMFAGIGYFSLPIAVHSHPKKIYAYEINPIAYGYLCENIVLNKVKNILPILSDNENAQENAADRVIMGYVHKTHKYLAKAMRVIKEKGGIIHYHEVCPNELLPHRPIERIKECAKNLNRTMTMLNYKEIKSYAPGVSHVVVDAEVR
jgi:tRNA wybutosine-synthesizing protein 2